MAGFVFLSKTYDKKIDSNYFASSVEVKVEIRVPECSDISAWKMKFRSITVEARTFDVFSALCEVRKIKSVFM